MKRYKPVFVWKFAILVFISGLLVSCSPKLSLNNSEKVLYPIRDDQPKDQGILNYYLPYKTRIDSLMKEVIAVSDTEITKDRPEGLLNNLVADAIFEAGKSQNIDFDLAYTNYGGLRIPLPKGNIPLFKIFELMPFENLLTTVKFTGPNMQRFLDYIAASGGDPVSGIIFKIKDKKAVDILIKGKPIDLNRIYTILTSDYMANGGDGGDIFLESTDRKEYSMKLRDAITLYLRSQTKQGRTVNPKKDGRIAIE